MAALSTTNRAIRRSEALQHGDSGQARPSVTFRRGGVVANRFGSSLIEVPLSGSPRTDLICRGIYQGCADFTSSATTDGGGGAVDANGNAEIVPIEAGCWGWFDTGTSSNQITAAHRGRVAYMYDDNTFYATDASGTLSPGGIVEQVAGSDEEFSGKVRIWIPPPALAPMVWALFGNVTGNGESPGMQAVNATLMAGTVTINTGITVAANSEVIPVMIGALTGTTNLAMLGELKASRVAGAPGVGTVVIQAYGDDGALDVDAAGAIRVIILTPQA